MNIETCGWNARWGWTAIDADNYDGAEDSASPVGVGATEQEAIKDLLEKLS